MKTVSNKKAAMKTLLFFFGVFTTILSGCSSTKEYVMPFKNYMYSGERLFPVSTSDAEFSFRAWVSYSTSVDRVFTISYDKDLGYQGKLLEIQSIMARKKKIILVLNKQILFLVTGSKSLYLVSIPSI